MDTNTPHSHWPSFIDAFNKNFSGRPTRLGVFERNNNVTNDFWIESGLPLTGVDLDVRNGHPSLRIDMGSYSHEVINVLKVTVKLSVSGEEDGIDILDEHGRTTVLRIEAA